jgi:nitroreductase
MEVFEAVRTVLAVRKFLQTPVPPEIVRRILEAGRLTASSMNRQPWHFVLVDDRRSLRELAELAPTGPSIADAGMAVAVSMDKSEHAVSDASRAIQSMILTAWSEGVPRIGSASSGSSKPREYSPFRPTSTCWPSASR